ncbi:DUF6545 domain-containing protein [Nocardia sp. NPDC051570]|uniref:DUF6545 domain-containing protein n=1 Tax=Nocardia sp. NPDC051570 TaxID=3364324 RepID=UPI00379B64B0
MLALRGPDRWHASPKERAHRRRIEIHDAAQIVSSFALPLPAVADESIEAAVAENNQEQMRLVAELVMAAQRLARTGDGRTTGEPMPCRTDVPNEQTLLRYWEPAKFLLADQGCEAPRKRRRLTSR